MKDKQQVNIVTTTEFKVVKGVQDSSGFTLIETIVAMILLMVGLLGTVSVFTYSVMYNTGNNNRSQALAVLKQEEELIRSAKFTPAITDTTLIGGEKPAKFTTSANGTIFMVEIVIDDDPYTSGLQVNNLKTLKDISIVVTPKNSTAKWQTDLASKLKIRRLRSN